MLEKFRLCQPTKASVSFHMACLVNRSTPLPYDELYELACKKYGGNMLAVNHHDYQAISEVINDILVDKAKGSRKYKQFKKAQKKKEKRKRKNKAPAPNPTAKAKSGFSWSIAQGHRFYASMEWKRIRYAVLKEYGAICQCCGQGRDSAKGIQIHVDHIKPLRKFPELRLDKKNLQVLCSDCNAGKGNSDDTDWR